MGDTSINQLYSTDMDTDTDSDSLKALEVKLNHLNDENFVVHSSI